MNSLSYRLLSLPVLAIATHWVSLGEVRGASYLTGGHIDGPAFGYVSADGFEPHFHNEGGADGAIIDGVRVTSETEYEPDELVIVVPSTSTTTVGTTTYFWLPENESDADAAGAPFLGIGLEELDPADWSGGTVTLRILDIRGPGQFLLWQNDEFSNPITFLDTAQDINSFSREAGSHTHFNWGFTADGVYEIDFGIEGTHTQDGFVSGSGTYTFMIPEPSSCLLGMLGALALARRRR